MKHSILVQFCLLGACIAVMGCATREKEDPNRCVRLSIKGPGYLEMYPSIELVRENNPLTSDEGSALAVYATSCVFRIVDSAGWQWRDTRGYELRLTPYRDDGGGLGSVDIAENGEVIQKRNAYVTVTDGPRRIKYWSPKQVSSQIVLAKFPASHALVPDREVPGIFHPVPGLATPEYCFPGSNGMGTVSAEVFSGPPVPGRTR